MKAGAGRLPTYPTIHKREGKSQLNIAFGCTGGKHRSVTFAEAVGRYLESKLGKIRITHRDIEKH